MNTSKRTMGRFTAVLLTVLVIAAAFCLPVSAAETTYTLPDVGMTLTLPEGAQILTPTTPADDPVWGTAKVLDTTEKITQMNEDGILAEIYAFDGACTIAVSAKSSDVALDLYNGAEEIPEEYDALMRQIVDTAVFPEFQPEPSAEVTPEMVWMLVVLGLLIALIVGFFVYRSVVNRRDKREKHAMADRLAAYRQSKLGHEDEGDGALRFVNETEHSDNAIKIFANFQAYRRRLFAPLFTILIGLVALYVVAQSGSSDNWWILLLLAACIVYSVYKIATASTSVTKAMIRSYSKMRSRKAAYYFYEGDFRITGLQASNLHPYFQITRMYETKEYFYMYFGEENTYFIAKDGFEQGDAESFREFMREKSG